MGRTVFRNYYEGHMDKPRGKVEAGEGGCCCCGGVEEWGGDSGERGLQELL